MNKQLLIKVVFVLTAAVSGFGFSACGSSYKPEPPKELTEEEKKAKKGREDLAAKKAEYTTIPAKEQLAKEPYRNKNLIFFRLNKDEWIMNDFGFDADSEATQILTKPKRSWSINLPKVPMKSEQSPCCRSVRK